MASYDYRSYPSDTQSRRHESRHRLRDDNPTSSSSSKHTYSYDPRYSYPPPRSRSPPQAFRSSRGARRRWPPAPIAEDEASSLAREFRPVKALDDEKSSEASCRGTIDQEPIIVEIDNNERRFVLVEDGRPSALPTPPSSDAEKDRRGRQKAPRIETDFNDVPVFTRRAPSPYAYTKPGNLNTGRSSGEFFLSPDVMTPPSASRARSAARSERSHKSSSRYSPTGPTHPSARPVKNEALRTPTTSDSGNDVSDDSELEPVNAASFRRKREPAQYSFTNTSLPKADRGTSVHDFVKKSDPCGGASSSRSQDDKIQNSKRNIDVASSSVPRRYEYSKQKPTPLKPTVFTQDDIYSRPSAGLSPSVGPLPGYNTGRAHSAAPVAPLSSAAASYYLPSPPGSPRNVGSKYSDVSPKSEPRSKPASAASSRASSPRASNLGSPYLSSSPPQSDTNFDSRHSSYSTYPYVRKDRARPPSRLASSVRQDSQSASPHVGFQSLSPARPATSLPYPDDESSQRMPAEEDHQYLPSVRSSVPAPKHHQRTPSGSAAPLRTQLPALGISRPPVPTRHASSGSVPNARPPPPRAASAFDVPRHEPTFTCAALLPPLPPCPRSAYSDRYDDWYTLDGSSSFDICPSCLDSIVGPTVYRRFFKRSPLRPPNTRTVCDFSSLWMRVAWLMTLKQQRPRLDLIQALASISATEQECPGRKKDIRAWYGIPDGNGGHLRNFHICPCDVRRIEALLPSLRGLFTRVYRSDPSRKRPCDFRTESQRFPAYLDLLIDADERATRERRADLTSFAKFARRKASTRECARDTVLFDEVWHYIPALPEFTVCEECYDDVVWPCIAANSPLALRFSRTAQMVHDDGLGSSCQLYSPRMRKVFLKAVEDDDLIYLKRKARDRKYTEIALQAENGKIQKLAKGKVRVHDAPYAGWQDGETLDVGRLEKKLERLAEQWKAWE